MDLQELKKELDFEVEQEVIASFKAHFSRYALCYAVSVPSVFFFLMALRELAA